MKHFYAYAVYEVLPDGTELPLYIGKGHDDTITGYSRLAYYAYPRFDRQVTIAATLRTMLEEGRVWATKKLLECATELESFAAERMFIAEIGLENLANGNSGGCSGWTLRPESRQRMSEARKGKKLGPISEEHRLALKEGARRRASDPAWRAAHSAKLKGRKPDRAVAEGARRALTGKPHANRATKARQREELCQKHREILEPFAGLTAKEILSRAGPALNVSHVSTIYRICERLGIPVKREVADLSDLSAAEKRQRRNNVYKKSYQKRREKILLKLKHKRDAAACAL